MNPQFPNNQYPHQNPQGQGFAQGQAPNQGPKQNFEDMPAPEGFNMSSGNMSTGVKLSQKRGDDNAVREGEQTFGKIVAWRYVDQQDPMTKQKALDDDGLPRRTLSISFDLEGSNVGRAVGERHILFLSGPKVEAFEALGVGIGDGWGFNVVAYVKGQGGRNYFQLNQFGQKRTDSPPAQDPEKEMRNQQRMNFKYASSNINQNLTGASPQSQIPQNASPPTGNFNVGQQSAGGGMPPAPFGQGQTLAPNGQGMPQHGVHPQAGLPPQQGQGQGQVIGPQNPAQQGLNSPFDVIQNNHNGGQQ